MAGQTRRSISVKGITYQRLKDFCDPRGQPISDLIERLVAKHLDEQAVPVPTEVTHKPKQYERRQDPPVTSEDIHSQHFTW